MAALYAGHRDAPTVKLKRQPWSRLLRSALGTQFTETDELFVEHTLLVNSAEIIAHLVLGLDVTDLQPGTLLGGRSAAGSAVADAIPRRRGARLGFPAAARGDPRDPPGQRRAAHQHCGGTQS